MTERERIFAQSHVETVENKEFKEKFLNAEQITPEDILRYAQTIAREAKERAAQEHGEGVKERRLLYLIDGLSPDGLIEQFGKHVPEIQKRLDEADADAVESAYGAEPTFLAGEVTVLEPTIALDRQAGSDEATEAISEKDVRRLSENKRRASEAAEWRALLYGSMTHLRRAILEALRKELDDDEFVLLEGEYKKVHGALSTLERVRHPSGASGILRAQERAGGDLRKNQLASFERLADKENPHVAKIRSFDAFSGRVIVEDRPLDTGIDLRKKIANATEADRQKKSIEAFQSVVDCIEGAVGLLQKTGVVLQDIKLGNIGRDRTTGVGFLFDLDGLVPEGTKFGKSGGRLWADPYWPPEWGDPKGKKKAPIRRADKTEMVYQFGKSLEILFDTPGFSIPEMQMVIRHGIVPLMTEPDPKKRITLDDALGKMKSALKEISV